MLNDTAKSLLDKPKQFAVVTTIEPSGQPQSSGSGGKQHM